MLFDIPLENVDEASLDTLINGQERESKSIEYKRELPGRTDADHKEFLYDLSSFANASGGDLIYGIEAVDGLPKKFSGFPKQTIEREVLRLESLVQTGIGPRIPGLHFKPVDLKSGDCVLVVRIPKTWAGPHMVVLKKTNKFYSRNSAGKYLLDIDDLRTAFSLGQELANKINAFRMDRANTVLNRDLSVLLPDAPKSVLHILPLIAFRPGYRIDLMEAQKSATNELIPMSASGWNRHFNYDGLLTFSNPDNVCYTYLQLFRNGCLEAVESETSPPQAEAKWLQGFVRREEIIACGDRLLALLPKLKVEPPYLVTLTLLGVRGYGLWSRGKSQRAHPIERDNLYLDEILVERPGESFGKLVTPIFDQICNACGFSDATFWT